MTLPEILFLITAGFGAGLVGSLFGLGGGILMVPVLTLALKVPMHNAVATSLLCVIATSSAAASRNLRSGIVNIRLGSTMELTTVVGAIIGSALAGVLAGRTLMIIFGFAMAAMAFPMARGVPDEAEEPENSAAPAEESFIASMDGSYFDHARKSEVTYRVRRLPLAMGVGSLAGILSGLLGVGGGILKVPVMSLWCDVPMKAATATSNFMIGVTAVASAILYYGRGEVSSVISAAAVVGVFAGSRTGAHLATRIHGHHLRRAFAIVMLVVASQMLWRSMRG